MYSYIIFDLDGTLLDTLPDIEWALNTALAEFGLPIHSRDSVRSMVGHGLGELVKKALGSEHGTNNPADDLAHQVTQRLRELYRQHPWRESTPYAGIPELLLTLKAAGFPLGVLTNKAQAVAELVVAHFFPGIFSLVQGESPERPRKPDPIALRGMVHKLASLHGEDTADTESLIQKSILIGDSEVDLLTARNAGCDSIGVLWGFRSRSELELVGARHFVDDCTSLGLLLGP